MGRNFGLVCKKKGCVPLTWFSCPWFPRRRRPSGDSPGGKDQGDQTRKKMARYGESTEGRPLRGNHGQENQVRGTHPFFLQTVKPRPDQRSGDSAPVSTMAKSISPRSTSAFRSLRRRRSPRENLLFRTTPTHSPRSAENRYSSSRRDDMGTSPSPRHSSSST